MTTVVCVVPVVAIEQFKKDYWKLTDYVIPESERKLKVPEKDGLSLWYHFYYYRTVDIFSQKMAGDQEHSDDEEDEDRDPKEKKAHGHKKKKYSSPIAEFIDAARDKMKIVVREFKFQSGQSEERKKKR